jgi:hypothetical protein
LRTLQGYIFRILQHLATKLCNFTYFSMLFPGIYFFRQDKKLVYNGNCLLAINELEYMWKLWQCSNIEKTCKNLNIFECVACLRIQQITWNAPPKWPAVLREYSSLLFP